MDHSLGTRIRTILALAVMLTAVAWGLITGGLSWTPSQAQQESPTNTTGITSPITTAAEAQGGNTTTAKAGASAEGVNTTTARVPSTANLTNITTTTVYSYITLPPVTRPPSSYEIGSWISGGFVAGLLAGLTVGYALFARGVAVKKQQTGKATAEKKRK